MRASFHGGLWALVALALCLPLTACGSGDDGAPGAPGASTGLLAGQVLNALSGDPIAGATITTMPAVAGVSITTNANGDYQARLPVGVYELACSAPNYVEAEDGVSILAAQTMDVGFDLDPVSRVIVTILGAPASTAPDASPFTLTVNTMVMDGESVVTGYMWEQKHGTEAGIDSPAGQSTAIYPAEEDDYKDALMDRLENLDRYRVVGVNPHALEAITELDFEVTVMTTTGDYKADVGIPTIVDFATWATGTENVPLGLPVLLSGPSMKSYGWSIAGPGNPVLNDANSRYPWFVPMEAGMYTISENNAAPLVMGDGPSAIVSAVLEIYAANWVGGIGSAVDTIPDMDAGCTNACHAGALSDVFADWSETGHAHIFTTQLETSDHYGPSCFVCHTVGYDTTVANGGFDDATDYSAFLAWAFPGGHGHPSPGNFQYMLANFPDAAKKTNIQCENCHGPNGQGSAHMVNAEARTSLSSDVCGYCHGEPPRHARFQQWEESGHANYELAIDESGGSCQDCHTAQGWLAAKSLWQSPDGEAGPRPNPSPEDAHPQTCALCHDPHNVGTTSGEGTNAPMRVQDNAFNLACGFDATNVGKGAICSTCHNGRRGLVNDQTGLPNPDQAPHLGPQTDVLFGQNAFFVDVGQRGAHAYLDDTCVTCHMELTPPPAELSYQLGGTNHTFEASLNICSECHGAFDGGTLADQFAESLHELEVAIEDALGAEIDALLAGGFTVQINGHALDDEGVSVQINIEDIGLLEAIQLTESHGRSAIDVTYDGATAYGARLGSGSPQGTLIFYGEEEVPDLNDPEESASLVSNGLFGFDPNTETAPEVLIGQAAWNYALLHADGSHGFHNPGFVADVLQSSLATVGDLRFAYWVYLVRGRNSSTSELWQADPSTGYAQEVVALDGDIRGIGFHSNGGLYGIPSSRADDIGLKNINPVTGGIWHISSDWSGSTPDIATDGATLYGSPSNNNPYFVSIDTSTGARTNIGNQVFSIGGSAFAIDFGGTAYWHSQNNLYTVDLTTGTTTQVAETPNMYRIYGMTFHQGELYGVTDDNWPPRVIRLDTTDGSWETVVVLPGNGESFTGIASFVPAAPAAAD